MTARTRRFLGSVLFGLGGVTAVNAVRFYFVGPFWLGGAVTILAVVLLVTGWRMLQRARAEEATQEAGRHPIPIRDGDTTTKALLLAGLVLLLPGSWLLRTDQTILGAPLLLGAVALAVIAQRRFRRLTGPRSPDGQSVGETGQAEP